jgi:hypothetical protein
MKPTHSNRAAFWADPVKRYHYLYGRRQLYRYPARAAPSASEPAPLEGFQPNSAWLPETHGDGPQTVEQLVTQGYLTVAPLEPESALIADRKHTAWLGLEDAIHQVQSRWAIYEQNWLEIQEGKAAAVNSLFEWESRYGWPASTEQHYILGERLKDLYAEERAERVSVWRDIARVRGVLPEAVQSYLTAYRKMEILKDTDGDGP